VGIFQCNSIQSAILQDLIGQIFATELDFIGKCPQCQQSVISLEILESQKKMVFRAFRVDLDQYFFLQNLVCIALIAFETF